jgi:hypothetical protein
MTPDELTGVTTSVLGDALSEASNVMRSTSGSHQLLCRH